MNTKTVKTQATFSNINVQSFLTDLSNYRNISGTGGLTSDITLYDFDFNRNEGSIQFHIKDGVIKFLNIIRLLEIGNDIRKGKMPPLNDLGNLGQTHFGTLTGDASIKNNLVAISSIHLSSDKLEGQGSGTLNLNTFGVNIRITAWLKSNKDQAIPIIVSGDIRHPSVQPDQSAILKTIINSQEKKIKKTFHKQIEKVLNNILSIR